MALESRMAATNRSRPTQSGQCSTSMSGSHLTSSAQVRSVNRHPNLLHASSAFRASQTVARFESNRWLRENTGQNRFENKHRSLAAEQAGECAGRRPRRWSTHLRPAPSLLPCKGSLSRPERELLHQVTRIPVRLPKVNASPLPLRASPVVSTGSLGWQRFPQSARARGAAEWVLVPVGLRLQVTSS